MYEVLKGSRSRSRVEAQSGVIIRVPSESSSSGRNRQEDTVGGGSASVGLGWFGLVWPGGQAVFIEDTVAAGPFPPFARGAGGAVLCKPVSGWSVAWRS